MTRRYLAFDIEIARPIPEGAADWTRYRPFGSACAATLAASEQPKLWYGQDPDGNYQERMSPDQLAGLVDHLASAQAAGFTILTWNGLGFDFDVLAEESGQRQVCQELAWSHVDMMFHFFCLSGFALGLDTAAQGMGLSGKTPGMHGALAPQYWQQGRYQQVLEYVAQDARTTLDLAHAVERTGRLRWRNSRGRPQFRDFPDGWLTAGEANRLPLPDVSWMRNPWSREKFTGWAGR